MILQQLYQITLMNKQKQLEIRKKQISRQKSIKILQQLRMHIKTQKMITKNSIYKDDIFENSQSHQNSPKRNFLSQYSQSSPNSSVNNNFQTTYQKNKILPEIINYKLDEVSSNFVKPSIPIRQEVSFTILQRRSRQKKQFPSKSMKIQFKELIPIPEISREDKIENYCKIRQEFKEVVNASNHISVKNSDSVFRAYVQKGNNGILIKQLLKKRWWWHLEQKDSSKAHLVWTEWFNKSSTVNLQQISNESPENLNKDYLKIVLSDEPKINSIKLLVDQTTFRKIKPRISLKNMNYFRANLSLNAKQGFSQSNVNKNDDIKLIEAPNNLIHNHIDGCLQLHSKKLLFKNLTEYLKKKQWDPFDFIPLTFYIDRFDSPNVQELLTKVDQFQANKQKTGDHNIWLIKPGENSNRGFGITIHNSRFSLQTEITNRLRGDQSKKSIIVQKYIEDCMLINNRKFDLRCYILLTTVNGILKGYWYNQGYIRTSSEQFNLDNIDNLMIHLTNDAVQKKNQTYGKYEDFNKMSFIGFERYLKKIGYPDKSFQNSYQQMKKIAYYLISSVSRKIRRKQYTFELFGLDFMLNDKLKPFLIEANSNPCLETSGVILGKLIPELVDNVLMTAVDPLFPAPIKIKMNKQYISKDYFRSNKFQLIFSEETQKQQ